MTPEQRLAHLLEVAPSPSNRGRLTHAWVSENVSLAVADGVYAAINAVSVPTALRYVTGILGSGQGIDTTAALWKTQAAAVADSDESLAPHLVLLRDFELIYRPRWQTEGYESQPTLESVTAEIAAETLADQKQDWQTRFDAILNQIGTAEQAAGVAALRTIADEMAGD